MGAYNAVITWYIKSRFNFSGNSSVPPTVLSVLNNEHLVKDGIALDFLIEVFQTLKQEKGISALITSLKKGQLENRLMEFFPLNKRTEEYLKSVFSEKDLQDVVKLHKAQASQEAKRELQQVHFAFTYLSSQLPENKIQILVAYS